MDNSERARHELLARLEQVLGPEEAATLMENLPPVPWSELATNEDMLVVKADVGVLKTDVAELKTDVGQLRTDMHHEFGAVRKDFAHLYEVLDLRYSAQASQFEQLTEGLDIRFAQQRSHMEAVVRERLDNQTKLMVFSILGGLLTTAVIAIGAAAV